MKRYLLFIPMMMGCLVAGSSLLANALPLSFCFSKLRSLAPQPLTLGEGYRRENLGQSKAFPNIHVVYLNGTTRAGYEIFVKDGILVDRDGTPADSTKIPLGFDKTHGILAVDLRGRLYLLEEHKLERNDYIYRHSSPVAGEGGYFFGMGEIKSGVPLFLGRSSGHYLTTTEHLYFFVSLLERAGVSLKDTKISDSAFGLGPLIRADQFIRSYGALHHD